jgi:hypothetical protein
MMSLKKYLQGEGERNTKEAKKQMNVYLIDFKVYRSKTFS